MRFLRLETSAVSKEEADYSNLYQNVSLYEFEVYADKPAAYLLEAPNVAAGENNTRYLQMPEAPEGYRVTYLGADYEQVIGADGEVFETIQEKEVEVGFLVEPEDDSEAEAGREVSFTIRVPAAEDSRENVEGLTLAEDMPGGNAKPEVIPAIAEWDGGSGYFVPGEDSRMVVQGEDLLPTAALFADRYREIMGTEISVLEGTWEEVEPGDFYLGYAGQAGEGFCFGGAAAGLGEIGRASCRERV